MRPAPLVLLALVAACAQATTTSTFSSMPTSLSTGSTVNIASLGASGGETLLETLSRRTPLLLRPRTGSSLYGPVDPLAVYLDGLFIGETDALRMVFTRDVYSVRRLSVSESAITYGPRHRSGVLVVTTMRRR